MSAFYRYGIEAANNADFRRAFQIADAAGTPKNLTGCALKMQVRDKLGSLILEASTAGGTITITSAAEGKFSIAVPAATMAAVSAGTYRHDMLWTKADGSVYRLWLGTFAVLEGVTNG